MPKEFTSTNIHHTLRENWGYDSFRPKQEEIISSILNGNDTLGLLPTGGGKSLTFQVPALMLDGITIVVTPLISLMKDQVDNLQKRGIGAFALYSGLTHREQKLAIEKCRAHKAKLLYVSPERLSSATFLDTLRELDIELIVVDEAHCISQWGYDFRPAYLKIASLRKIHPHAPILALTASATPEVAADICRQLEFRDGYKCFSLSFARPNISFVVRRTEDKMQSLTGILSATGGSAIVYVRSRTRTKEIADALNEIGISAEHYHAGLVAEDKNERQNRWKNNETRVMVATNAFGMGIDKPDVRVVVHYDIPSSLEEYYQEAGRAGRDGNHSYAVLLTVNQDKGVLTRRISDSFPPKEVIRRIYSHSCDFLGVAVGEGFNRIFEFNLPKFCKNYNLNPTIAHNSLLILSRAGMMEYADDSSASARLMITMQRDELYGLELTQNADRLLQTLLRSYPGLFADYIPISEASLALKTNIPQESIYELLLYLSRMHVVSYIPRRTTPYIYLPTAREDEKYVVISRAVYEDRRADLEKRIEAMRRYAFGDDQCRELSMLEYFGEKNGKPCGHCDYCRAVSKIRKEVENEPVTENYYNRIETLLSEKGTMSIQSLLLELNATTPALKNVATEAVRQLADNEIIRISGLKVSLK